MLQACTSPFRILSPQSPAEKYDVSQFATTTELSVGAQYEASRKLGTE